MNQTRLNNEKSKFCGNKTEIFLSVLENAVGVVSSYILKIIS